MIMNIKGILNMSLIELTYTHIKFQFKKIKISLRLNKKFMLFINRIRVRLLLCSFAKVHKIYVIGDSHTDIFSNNKYENKILIYGDIDNQYSQIWFNYSEKFITYHFEAVTAYNSNNPNATVNSLKKINYLLRNGFIPKDSTVLTCYGEIDCRVHIKQQAEKHNISINDEVNRVVNNYLEYLLFLKNKHLNIVAYGPIPSQSDKVKIDEKYPRFGTEQERNEITKIFNEYLKEACVQKQIKFVTLFDTLINSDNTTKQEFLTTDKVHLGIKALPLVKNLYKEITEG